MKWWMVGAVAVSISTSIPAWAEDPAATSTAVKPEQLVDVVKLKNGGMVRGVIVELVPDDHVDILPPGGGQKRFAWTDVEYAGPASGAPKAAPPPAEAPAPAAAQTPSAPAADVSSNAPATRPLITVNAQASRLRLESEPLHATFHLKTSVATSGRLMASGYERICTAPCSATLPAGTYEMALSAPGGAPLAASDPVTIAGGETLQGQIESRSGLRIGGLMLGVVSTAVGAALVLTADPLSEKGKMVGGAAVMLVGGVVGFSLAFVPDSASIKVAAAN